MKTRNIILVSACLLGLNTKYNGKNNFSKDVINLKDEFVILPVCPEQLVGLPTPRNPAEIVNGAGEDVISGRASVKTIDGENVTDYYLKGAFETLKLVNLFGVKYGVFKEGSPSCGVRTIYDGTFSHTSITGSGVTVALLKSHGVEIFNENETELLLRKIH